jgi:hypothetical protein
MPTAIVRAAWGSGAAAPVESPGKIRLTQPRPNGNRFQAEVDLAELDERDRPGMTWQSKSAELSRSNLVLVSRRMCYVGRSLAIAIHLIDDRPVPLLGRVVSCEYNDDGLYRIDLDLLKIEEGHAVYQWAHASVVRRAAKPRSAA